MRQGSERDANAACEELRPHTAFFLRGLLRVGLPIAYVAPRSYVLLIRSSGAVISSSSREQPLE